MNLKNLPSCVLLGALCVGVADADWITEWNDNQLGVDYEIVQVAGTIRILRGGDEKNYKFYSETFEGSGVPGVINNITVDAGAMGDFSILIDHPDPGEFGALDWAAGDLRHANGVSTIKGIDLSGALVTSPSLFPPLPPLDIFCERVVGDINAASLSQSGAAGAPTLRKFVADEIIGNITLGAMIGDIDTDFLAGGDFIFTVNHNPGLGAGRRAIFASATTTTTGRCSSTTFPDSTGSSKWTGTSPAGLPSREPCSAESRSTAT